jgi:hypothetical protein
LLALKVPAEIAELALLGAALALGHGHRILVQVFLHPCNCLAMRCSSWSRTSKSFSIFFLARAAWGASLRIFWILTRRSCCPP